MAALAAHGVPGLDRTDTESATHARAVTTPSGPAVLDVAFREAAVVVSTDAPNVDEDWLATTVRRWLDLDAVPARIDAGLAADPLIGPLVASRPGLRVLGYADPYAGAVMTVIGQQVSLAATRTFGGRLVAAFGEEARGADDIGARGFGVKGSGVKGSGVVAGKSLKAFPSPAKLASLAPGDVQRTVGLTAARARTVVTLAQAFVYGLDLGPGADLAATRAELLRLPGIGPWTVDYLSVRALRDTDAFVPGDLVLRRALGGMTARDAEAASEAWRPYRAYALYHLWTEAAYLR